MNDKKINPNLQEKATIILDILDVLKSHVNNGYCPMVEQLEELIFLESAEVRDGTIAKGDMVWWRSLGGPEYVNSDSGSHWDNIKNYPGVYSIAQPIYEVKYLD